MTRRGAEGSWEEELSSESESGSALLDGPHKWSERSISKTGRVVALAAGLQRVDTLRNHDHRECRLLDAQ